MQSQFIHFTLKSLIRRRKVIRLPISLCSLTISIVIAVTILYSIIDVNQNKLSRATYGSWNFAIYNISHETDALISNNKLINQVGTMKIYGEIKTSLDGKSNYIGYVDPTAYEQLSITLEQGRYPQTVSEIALEKELLLSLGIESEIGSEVTLDCITSHGKTLAMTFTLCGIMNSYHNSYLKQGPLATAFVSVDCSAKLSTPKYINRFITLKEGFTSEAIVNELHDSVRDNDSSDYEKWHYNTYIVHNSQLLLTMLFLTLALIVIMMAALYRCLLNYFSRRFKTLLDSQILFLDKKKILKILWMEVLVIIVISLAISCLQSAAVIVVMYNVAKHVYTDLILHIPGRCLCYSLLLSLCSIIFFAAISLFHSFSLCMRQPVLRLPSTTAKTVKTHYNRFFYIMKRFIKVYKRSHISYLSVYTLSICTIIIVSATIYYTHDCSVRLRTDSQIDYSIQNISDLNSLAPQLEQLNRVNEISYISHFRYTIVNSYILVDFSSQNNTLEANNCYLSITPGFDSSSLPLEDNTFSLYTQECTFKLNVKDYYNTFFTPTKYPVFQTPNLYIYCSTETFNHIIDSIGITPYNNMQISFTGDSNPYVVTNILDSILFEKHSIKKVHNRLDNEKTCFLLVIRTCIISIISLFMILTSTTILRNQQKVNLEYWKKDLKILWLLGFDKKALGRFFKLVNLLYMILSSLIALIPTYLYYYYKQKHGAWFYPFDLEYFYSSPGAMLLTGTLLFVYYFVYLQMISKDLKRTVENF